MLGHDLRASVPSVVGLSSFAHADLDVTHAGTVRDLIRAERPRFIINAAAFTDVDAAESEPGQTDAFRVNAAAPGVIGAAAAEVGATVVHFSTDYVFDGESGRPYREDDEPNPLNVYGRSKLEGERALRASGAAHLIVRTQWLFGIHGRSFAATMWHRALRGERTSVVADQFGRPTSSRALADAVWRLIERGVTGTVHVVNSGTASWYEIAVRVFTAAGRAGLVQPSVTTEYGAAAPRPRAAVLDSGLYERLTASRLPPWQDALDEFVALL
jgi:dTDP-4-dehydrorhamnose reductase